MNAHAFRAFRYQDPLREGRRILVDLISGWWREGLALWLMLRGSGPARLRATTPASSTGTCTQATLVARGRAQATTGLHSAGEQIDLRKKHVETGRKAG